MSEPSDVAPSVPPLPPAQTGPGTHEVTVDLAAFLPEDTELVGGAPDTWDTGAPEPEVPSWARDHEAEPVAQVESEPAPPPTAEAELAPEGDALARIDRELAAVDDALVALDAGTPEASPLLRELLAD